MTTRPLGQPHMLTTEQATAPQAPLPQARSTADRGGLEDARRRSRARAFLMLAECAVRACPGCWACDLAHKTEAATRPKVVR